MRYVAKPIEIEAVEWVGNLDALPVEWRALDMIFFDAADHLVVRTNRGPAIARVGDFIIRGRTGEFYPVDPATFHDKYEPVTEW